MLAQHYRAPFLVLASVGCPGPWAALICLFVQAVLLLTEGLCRTPQWTNLMASSLHRC